jgi:leucyl/phenylalanyl-tRNA--protein transferase
MSPIRWLSAEDPPESFPPPAQAELDPNGLLAVGADLGPERLLYAYTAGIFPWYEEGQPVLWWSPDPRSVLWPHSLRVSRSLRRKLKRGDFQVSADRAFSQVLAACAEPRSYGSGTWITAEMAAAYRALHALGWAHSFETWQDGRLVGGLYGVYIGRVFFGESMFARSRDASKVAFVKAVSYLESVGCALIDCQVSSPHLESLGATTLPRERFLSVLDALCTDRGSPASWNEPFARHCDAAPPRGGAR